MAPIVDREGEEGLQSEEKMGDLTRLPAMTSRHLQLCTQRPEPCRQLVSEVVKALGEELQIARHRLGIVDALPPGLGVSCDGVMVPGSTATGNIRAAVEWPSGNRSPLTIGEPTGEERRAQGGIGLHPGPAGGITGSPQQPVGDLVHGGLLFGDRQPGGSHRWPAAHPSSRR